MVSLTGFSKVTDGDKLYEGFFNETVSNLLVNIIRNGSAAGTSLYNGVASASIEASTTTAMSIDGSWRPGGALYDDYEDGVLDTSKTVLTTSGVGTETIVEESGHAYAARDNTGGLGGSNDVYATFTHDFSTSTGKTIFYLDASAGISPANGYSYVTFGGVTIYSVINSGFGETKFYFVLSADKNTCTVYVNGVYDSTVDVSGATSGKYEMHAHSGGDYAFSSITIYETRYVDDGASFTDTITFSNNPTITTDEEAIICSVQDSLSGATTRAIKASFDGGTNYTTITNNEISNVANKGTSLKLKVEYSLSNSGDDFSFDEAGFLYG